MSKERIEFEVIICDSRGVRTSCGTHQSEIEDYTYCVPMPENYCLCGDVPSKLNFVSIRDIHLKFIGKVKD